MQYSNNTAGPDLPYRGWTCLFGCLFVFSHPVSPGDLRTQAYKPLSSLYEQMGISHSEKGKQSLRSRLLHATIPTPGFRNRSTSPSSPSRIPSTESATRIFTRQTVQLAFIAPPPDMYEDEIAKGPLASHAPSTQALPRTKSPANDFSSEDNLYAAIGRLPTTGTQTQQIRSAAYEGLKTVLDGLYDCSDMLLPLKAASGLMLTIIKIVDVRDLNVVFTNYS